MLFHTWPFLLFMLVVLPVYFALRRTSLWIPWLLAASYFFYGWWNPWYLLLVAYSTALDYLLVLLMDHTPRTMTSEVPGTKSDFLSRAVQLRFEDPVLRSAYIVSGALLGLLTVAAIIASPSLRPALLAFALLVFFMALGAAMASRRAWLFVSIFNNLALLLFFKYARFLSENVNALFHATHLHLKLADPSRLMPTGMAYVLPVGISFFTFQSMSYTIDFYHGRVERERHFLRFATFVCFFPQLMAGPIERARNLLPQFQQAPPVRLKNFTDGLSLLLVGLFKKLALADYLAIYVDRVYDNPAHQSASALLLATFAFAWQIYFDFSGYTDMARGVAKLLGFDLILNFNNPYLATGLGDFWQRWHISLSTWFRDYVYIPLGGSRRGSFNTYRNLLITFVVSGIWHGAAWTFAIWGLLHALGIMLTRQLERSAAYRDRVPKIAKQAWTFAYVCFAWIFFRAASLADGKMIVGRIFTWAWTAPRIPALMLLLIALVWLYEKVYESSWRSLLRPAPVRVAIAVMMVVYLCFCSGGGGAFIYFQF